MRVYFTRNFLNKLDRSPEKIHKHFEERLKLFVLNPFTPVLNNHPRRGELSDCRSINITGDWRAIFKIQDEAHYFVDIGPHSKLYRK